MPHPVEHLIRDVPDFPKPGILFKDLTPLFLDPGGMRRAMTDLADSLSWDGVDAIAGIEARGFVLGGYLAAIRDVGLIPIRKAGKLPYETVRETYDLEYGTDTLEIHRDACDGKSVLLIDDVLATGGTAAAAARLVEKAGGRVLAAGFLLELDFLAGRKALGTLPIRSLIHVAE